ncbi:MAG: hypothetical protein JSV52_09835 [Candidatus Zixiibacteriota bacterium]|nr:MAG: hypothetical protein JSV52_09835 [candidate division Zixibacteria bacterium]
MPRILSVLIPAVVLCLAVSGCVKVDVSTDLTDEEKVEISKQTAARIRAEWAKEIRYASPVQRVRLLHSMWLAVTTSYINLGRETVAKWRYLESISDVPVCASEVKKMLDRWMLTEEPVFSAYEDNITFTLEEIESSHYFEKDFLETISLLGKHYNKVCEIAFNPSGSPKDFEYALELLEFETSKVSDRVKEAMTAL